MFKKNSEANLVQIAHKTDNAGLVTASAGNISIRKNNNRFLISGSGKFLGSLKEKDISNCNIDNDKDYTGARPSIESALHRKLYKKRIDINAILHFQSTYATILACMPLQEFDLDFIPETVVYLKKISIIPYYLPGSSRLSEEVSKKADGTDIFILQNHGQLALGADPEDAFKKAAFFELACKISYLSQNKIKKFSKEEIDELLDNYG